MSILGLEPGIARPCSWPDLVERITRNFGEKRLTGAVFLDVAKAFDTVWIDGLLYKLALLNFPSYIVYTFSSFLRGRTFEVSFQTATSSRRGMRTGIAQGGLISPVLFSLYINDMPSPSHHVDLADDTAIIATSASRRCSSATWSHTSTTFNGGWVNRESPLMSLRAPR